MVLSKKKRTFAFGKDMHLRQHAMKRTLLYTLLNSLLAVVIILSCRNDFENPPSAPIYLEVWAYNFLIVTSSGDFVDYFLPGEPMPNPYLINANGGFGTYTVTVKSNTTWRAISSGDWCKVLPNTHVRDGKPTVYCSENNTGKERSANLVFRADTVMRVISIVQPPNATGSVKLSVKPAVLEFNENGGIEIVTVSSTQPFTITADANWLTVDPAFGNAGTYTIHIKATATSEERAAVVTVSAGTSTKTVNVSQFTEKGILIGGVTWATRNVGDPGKFAATINDFGKVYQFNSKIAYDAPTDDDDIPFDWNYIFPGPGDWTPANDPCPAGWHIPSINEWEQSFFGVVDQGYLFNDEVVKTVPAGQYGATVKGYLLGYIQDGRSEEILAATDIHNDFVIFIPQVRLISNGGGLSSEDNIVTRLWTSTGAIDSDDMTFNGIIPNVEADDWEKSAYRAFVSEHPIFNCLYIEDMWDAAANRNKTNAYSIRCVKN